MLNLNKLTRRLFSKVQENLLASAHELVAQTKSYELAISLLSDSELRVKTQSFREQLASGRSLDEFLPEAFAICREALRRTLGISAYDVQIIGGILLHEGKIAEMATGEGKTFVAMFAAYLNSLQGKGVHVATVNEYLAKRDANWMSPTYAMLGITCGLVYSGQLPAHKRQAYRADVTYSIYSELAFDFLNDNRRSSILDMVQRPHAYAIIDEADSILIDEARTPLIISGPSQDKSLLYVSIDQLVRHCGPDHFELNKTNSSVMLTDEGINFFEEQLRNIKLLSGDQGLYDSESNSILLHIIQALRAHHLFGRDRHYLIRGQDVVLVNSATGRMMENRRLMDGLHQAIEAKEGVPIKPESVTLASATVQNYFRLYPKLAGMSGTAATDADELMAVYGLGVVPLPTHNPKIRVDHEDRIFLTETEKDRALIEVVLEVYRRKQPLLIGTASIEKSMHYSTLFGGLGIAHSVLNAHEHERESEIVANAGRLGAVTIATNMAGRGTDIKLGGNVELKLQAAISGNPDISVTVLKDQVAAEHDDERKAAEAAGGLFVLGTQLHESRRIDNQLRGRSGRQGDPGQSQFILSLEDELVEKVEPEWLDATMAALKAKKKDEQSQRNLKELMRQIQKRVENRNFELRKHILKFDDVIDRQRNVVYEQRLELMSNSDFSGTIKEMRRKYIEELIAMHMQGPIEPHTIRALEKDCLEYLNLSIPLGDWLPWEELQLDELSNRICLLADVLMQEKEEVLGHEAMRALERQIFLQAIDLTWREHSLVLEQLRSTIGLRSFGRRDPLGEFRVEALEQFEHFLRSLRREVTVHLAQARILSADEQLALMAKLVI